MPYSREQFYAENIPLWRAEGREEGRAEGEARGVIMGEIRVLQKIAERPLDSIQDLRKMSLDELQKLREEFSIEFNNRIGSA